MAPIDFNESNTSFGPPSGKTDGQVGTIHAHIGEVRSGPNEGTPIIVTCWVPTPAEREAISNGTPIYLTVLGTALPPHTLTTFFPTTL